MNKKLLVLAITAGLLTACSKVDDYVLGKDNSPKPKALTEIKNSLDLKPSWSVPIANKAAPLHFSRLGPTLKGGLLYTADATGRVLAIDAKTGNIVWAQSLNDSLIAGPVLAANSLAICSHSARLHLLNQADGKERWQVKLSSDALAKPLIAGNKVVVKTIDGNLYAFDLQTGQKAWTSAHGAPDLILRASSSPVQHDGLVLAGFPDGRLDAVDLKKGGLRWQRSLAYASGASDVERLVDIDADPLVEGDRLYLASYQGYVGAMSIETGEFIWRKPASTYKNIAIDTKALYLSDSNDVLWAYDKHSGKILWKQNALKARVLTAPVLMGQYLVLGDKTGFLHLVSKNSGALLGRINLASPIEIAAIVSGQAIYVQTANGKLSRFLLGK